jgi:prepilin-type N-terminal cleavage/methylation domain-containing protein
MKPRIRSHWRARAGFTLTEMSITLVVMIVLGAALAQSSGALRIVVNGGTAQDLLMSEGMQAMERIRDDLKCSGFVGAYPYTFVGGAAGDGFDVHDHEPAVKHATGDAVDAGSDREVVFVRPADDDGDGVPDIDGNGAAVWGGAEFSYVRVNDASGSPVLERRTDGAAGDVVAHHVERVLFDTQASDPAVPAETVRVTIYFRKLDAGGHLYKYTAQSMVKLRNQ